MSARKPVKLESFGLGPALIAQVIGKEPRYQPYLWLGDEEGVCFGVTRNRRDLVRLRDAINASLRVDEENTHGE